MNILKYKQYRTMLLLAILLLLCTSVHSCTSQCANCSNDTPPVCQICQANDTLYQTNCTKCEIQFCSNCSANNVCQTCQSGYYIQIPIYYISNNTCQKCPVNCTQCDQSTYGSMNCTTCEDKYYLSSGPPYTCPQICGDLQAILFPCDDQIGILYDGCTDTCEQQPDFICNKTYYTSICSYQKQIILQIISIELDQYSNSFTMRVTVWPPLYIFRNSDLKSVFMITNPIFIIDQVQFDHVTSQFIFKVNFTETCWNCELVLQFVPDVGIDQRYFASVNSSASVNVKLYYYSDLSYKITEIIPYICYTTLVIGMLAAFLGLFAKRLPGLESIIACQMAFISIIWINTYLIQPFRASYPLKYVLGYHINMTNQYSNSTARILTIQQNPYYSDYPFQVQFGFHHKILANNINIFLFIQAIAFFASIITAILVKCFDMKLRQKIKQKDTQDIAILQNRNIKAKYVKQISFQCLMYVGMFNITSFTTFSILFFRNNTTYTDNILNLIILSLGIIFYACSLLLFWRDPDPFDYFRYSFKRKTLAMNYYFLYTFSLIGTIILLQIINQVWAPLIPIGCLLVFTLIYRPYHYLRQNIRSCFNFIIILAFLSFRVLIKYKYQASYQVDDLAFIYFLVCMILMLVGTIIALAFIIYQFVYLCLLKQNKNEIKQKVMYEFEQTNVRKQIKDLNIENKQTVFGQLLSPKMNILQFSNIANYIKEQKLPHGQQSLNDPNSTGRLLRKQMQKQKIQKNYSSFKKKQRIINKITENQEIVDNMKIQNIKIQLKKQQKDKNEQIIYAVEVLNNQNLWIRLKNARDFTTDYMKQGVKQQFIQEYNLIQ